ncbi:MAG: mechanosensitive ion channel family protein, partial [Anaerolineaceae bacterium]|nr:mechanosensitive ion channel family protein [Anaerolineaceae bacterium]
MIDTLQAIWANDLYRKLILSGLVLLVMHLIRRVLNWVLQHKVSFENPYIYLLRKVSSYLISILTVFFIFGIWIERLGDLSVALGIMTAGLAFALQEVIGSFAGWLTIVGGKPFSVGDRIETSHIRGDVVDVGILRTKIMEIGNWLHGDHNTGRIVTVSNALIFKEPLFNYSILFHYIYDEIVIPVIYDCDWKRAIEIMHRAVSENQHYQTLLPKARKSWEQARQQYLVKISP